MNKILLFLTALILLLVMFTTASAVVISIDNDKVLNISGVRTFPVGIYHMCSPYHDNKNGYESCEDSIAGLPNFTYSQRGFPSDNSYWDTNAQYFTGAGIYYTADSTPSNIGSRKNDTYFLGYYQNPEEPTTPAAYSNLYSRYNTIKGTDSNHPVMVAMWTYKPSGSTYNASQVADIVEEDVYAYKTNCGYTDRIMQSTNCANFYYFLDDFIFARERTLKTNVLSLGGTNTIDGIPKPLYLVVEGHGMEWVEGATTWRVIPENKLRAYIYWAITAGYSGIDVWGYKYWGNGTTSYGLVSNATIRTYYNSFAGELTSPYIQDVLLLPTLNYSWNYAVTWDTKVTFSTNPTRSAYGTTGYGLTYRLKYNTTSNKYYLIVANKLNVSVSPTITISGLTGTQTATTMGITGTGSSAPNRHLTVISGVFTDTIDAYAGHIYEIASSNPAPIITSWGNTKTNNVSTSFSLNASESVTFNATANQTITTWNWYNDGQASGNNTNSYTVSFLVGGTKNISVSATNAKGISNLITWNISVPSTSSTDPKIGFGGVAFSSGNSNFNHTVVNKGDGKVTVGLFADNCNDGTSDWEKSAFTCKNGTLNPLSSYSEAWQNVTEYTNVSLLFKINEYTLNTWDVDMRALHSRDSISKRYAIVRNSSSNYLHIQVYNGTWNWVNSTTWERPIGVPQYYIFDLNGNNINVYTSNVSFSDSRNSLKLSWTDSLYPSGDYIVFAGRSNMSYDDIRLIQYNRFSGSLDVNYDAGANNQTNSIIINATTPTSTNYTVSYRQKFTGLWIPLGETYTENQTLSFTGTKYQDTEINITLFGNGTSFPEIETIEFIREQAASSNVYPRYDVDENGIVDMDDLTLVGQHFNEIVSIPYPRYDVNLDGLVNIDDITIVGQHFGEKY